MTLSTERGALHKSRQVGTFAPPYKRELREDSSNKRTPLGGRRAAIGAYRELASNEGVWAGAVLFIG